MLRVPEVKLPIWRSMNNLRRVASVLLSILTACSVLAQSCGIRNVDFKNFMYSWDGLPQSTPMSWHWIETPPERKIRLAKGQHRFIDPRAPEIVREHPPVLTFDSVTYGDLDGDATEEAAVALNYSTGGTANWDYLYIYKLDHGSLKLLSRMECGSRAAGGLITAAIQEGVLILDFADIERRVGECCSEGIIRVRYRWHDGQFVEEGAREKKDMKSDVHQMDLGDGHFAPASWTFPRLPVPNCYCPARHSNLHNCNPFNALAGGRPLTARGGQGAASFAVYANGAGFNFSDTFPNVSF